MRKTRCDGRLNLLMAGGFVTSAAIAAMACSDMPVSWLMLIAFVSGLPSGAIWPCLSPCCDPKSAPQEWGSIIHSTTRAWRRCPPSPARDRSGSIAAPMLFAAAMMALAVLLLFIFRMIGQPQPRAVAGAQAS
jgi:hypothetical protein